MDYEQILKEALEQARSGRLHLKSYVRNIRSTREDLSSMHLD